MDERRGGGLSKVGIGCLIAVVLGMGLAFYGGWVVLLWMVFRIAKHLGLF